MNEQIADDTLDGPRPARIEEREDLIGMVNLIFRIAAGREPTIASDWPHVYSPSNLENVMVVSDRQRGEVVASTGVWASETRVGDALLRVGGINCVGTLQEYRRHGLGSQVMQAAQTRMGDLDCHVGLLVTGIMNWYRKLGWEEAGGVRSYRLNRGNIGLLPPLATGIRCRFATVNETVNEDAEEDQVAAEIVRLRNQDRLGATRTLEGFRQLYAARRSPQIVLAELEGVSEGAAIAYILVRENLVLEWGGNAQSVAALVRIYFETLDDPGTSTTQRNEAGRPLALQNLTLMTPTWQHPLLTLLDAVCLPYATEYLGMLFVVEPRRLLDAYALSAVKVERAGDEFILEYKGERAQFTRNQLAKLFFGPERISNFAADLFPLPFWQWILEKV